MTANLGTLAVGATATLTIVVDTDRDSVGTITDSASASCEQTDPTGPHADATVTTHGCSRLRSVRVALTASPSPVLAGGDLTDTFTISNLGPDAANGVTATLAVGGGCVVCFGPVRSLATVTSSNGQVIASVATMAANTQAHGDRGRRADDRRAPSTRRSPSSSDGIDDNLATMLVRDHPGHSGDRLVVSITASASVGEYRTNFDYSVIGDQ